jgi:hypothetical protein
MGRKTKTFAFVFVLLAWSGYATASHGEDSRDPSHFTYARLYCAPDGNSHFQDVTVDLRKTDFAPPAPPIHIGSDFAHRGRSSAALTRAGACRTWKIDSIILLPQRNSASSCKVAFPSPRPTVRPGDCVPGACFDWRTPRPARDTSPLSAISPDF